MPGKYRQTFLFKNPNGPGDARPTAIQILEDENRAGDLVGKVIIVTGASSGLGAETVRVLSATGATIFGAVRDVEKGKKALGDLAQSDKVHLLPLDLGSLDSVRNFAEEFRSQSNQLNILVNNAGVMGVPEGTTQGGFETHFGTNHLGHFLLFWLLKDLLIESSSSDFASRVINISSSEHRQSAVHLDNVNLKAEYNSFLAYGQSKTANIHMANQIERLYGFQGVHGLALAPGGVQTSIGQHLSEEAKALFADPKVQIFLKSVEQGAATTIFAAVGRELEGKGGIYLENCEIGSPAPENATPIDYGYAPWAFDQKKEENLWQLSLELVGEKEA
ncbi:hypothetical protein EDB81DRAFT_764499 [Dactylonectria macrodidyma]|uniref:Uncharacterized protein n=1 Tax=Dactylonectria macrodidyma TaxID=307937 RepID=A0A9P9DX22_9HYPO|nr:hypothetical protein EDB81DRAFT_764499 [Dactylonectria macrodidyma]